VAVALVLAAAGCASSSGGDKGVASADRSGGAAAATGASAAASLSPQDKALKFAQCMREHGIPMDDPDPNGGDVSIGGEGIDMAKMQAAQQACKEYSPFGVGGPTPDPKMAENMRNFAQCMRDNGVPNFPDPDGGRVMIDASVGADPDFPAAQKKCEKEFLPGAASAGR
jgi:hypothetical protein